MNSQVLGKSKRVNNLVHKGGGATELTRQELASSNHPAHLFEHFKNRSDSNLHAPLSKLHLNPDPTSHLLKRHKL